ncbi:MAG: hypothetical protein ABJE95_24290 [Byssovorax sp.]
MSKLAPISMVVGSVSLLWIGCGSEFGTAGAGAGASTTTGTTTTSGSDATSGSNTTGGNTTTGSASSGSGGAGGSPVAMPIFETDIVPIFTASCGAGNNACHSEVSYSATQNQGCRGWLSLKDAAIGSQIYGGPQDGTPTGCPDVALYDRLLKLGAWEECGNAVKKYIVPCDVEASYLFDKINGGPYCGPPPSNPMPSDKPIKPADRETIRAWILAGAPRKDGSGVKCGGSGAGGGDAGAGQPPQAKINHPGDMEMRPANVAIPFIGVGTDPEDGNLIGASLVWTSNLSGQIGTGTMFSAPLTAGTHVVTLTVTDSAKNTATSSLTLYIQ